MTTGFGAECGELCLWLTVRDGYYFSDTELCSRIQGMSITEVTGPCLVV